MKPILWIISAIAGLVVVAIIAGVSFLLGVTYGIHKGMEEVAENIRSGAVIVVDGELRSTR